MLEATYASRAAARSRMTPEEIMEKYPCFIEERYP